MIVVEERICWKIFQCKRVMREKDLSSLSALIFESECESQTSCESETVKPTVHISTNSLIINLMYHINAAFDV
jgi:hypothetical protein